MGYLLPIVSFLHGQRHAHQERGERQSLGPDHVTVDGHRHGFANRGIGKLFLVVVDDVVINAQERIDAQVSDERRLAIADEVIETSGSLEETIRQTDALWERIRSS